MRTKITPIKKVTTTKIIFENIFGVIAKMARYHQYSGTHSLTVNRERIVLPGARLDFPIKILHLSDFHASKVVPYRFIENAIDVGISLAPDLICLTGDYCTHRIPASVENYRRILQKLPAVAPTFACFGNHDCCYSAGSPREYVDFLHVGELLRSAGIRVLFNEKQQVTVRGEPLTIAGLGDISSCAMHPGMVLQKIDSQRRHQKNKQQRKAVLLNGNANIANIEKENNIPDSPIILLSHNPDTKKFLTDYHWDLLLSGHTHGGQFKIPGLGAPFAPVRDSQFAEGLHQWNSRWIHVTRGVGNVHGLRINCPPQVSLLELN